MGITKNKQTKENIVRMAKAVFKDKENPQIIELTEGMCNVAYKLNYNDGFSTILKIASPIKEGFMTNEVNLMKAEVKAMKTVAENTDIKVAQVYKYDTTKEFCAGEYFFMENIDGVSLSSILDKISDEVKANLSTEVGVIQKKLSRLYGERFGLLGDDNHQFTKLFDFTYFLINNILDDADKRDVVVGVSKETIMKKLESDSDIFDEITTPSLVHWDMWEGNIFVKGEHVSGIIDWERAMWGDPMMDDRFRYHNRNTDFLKGFGIEQLSSTQLRRIFWYDILLYLTMMTEVTYREYEDNGQYDWAKSMFEKVWNRE